MLQKHDSKVENSSPRLLAWSSYYNNISIIEPETKQMVASFEGVQLKMTSNIFVTCKRTILFQTKKTNRRKWWLDTCKRDPKHNTAGFSQSRLSQVCKSRSIRCLA